MLPRTQSGFRGKHGTATGLAEVTDEIITASDGKGTIFVLLDFFRAFDSLTPNLSEKKWCYGVSGNSSTWFKSLLSGSKQYVEIQTEKGETLKSNKADITRVYNTTLQVGNPGILGIRHVKSNLKQVSKTVSVFLSTDSSATFVPAHVAHGLSRSCRLIWNATLTIDLTCDSDKLHHRSS